MSIPKKVWTILALLGCLLVITVSLGLNTLPGYAKFHISIKPIQAPPWRDIGLAFLFLGLLLEIRPFQLAGCLTVIGTEILAFISPQLYSQIVLLLQDQDWLALLGAFNSIVLRASLILLCTFAIIKTLYFIPPAVGIVLGASALLATLLLVHSITVTLPQLNLGEDWAGILLCQGNLLKYLWFMVFALDFTRTRPKYTSV